jgi:hypothetical protein
MNGRHDILPLAQADMIVPEERLGCFTASPVSSGESASLFNWMAAFLVVSAWTGDGPEFEAVTTGPPVVGPCLEFTKDGSCRIGPEFVQAGRLVELRQTGVDVPGPPADKPLIRLTNGDIWPTRAVVVRDDRVWATVDLGVVQEVDLPLDRVAEVRFRAGPARSATGSIDEVHLSNGDVVRGTIAEVAGSQLTMQAAGRPRQLPLELVTSIAVASPGGRPTAKPPSGWSVVTLNGARITLADAQLADGRLVGRTTAGSPVRVRLGDVARLAATSDPAVFLDSLTPRSYEHVPFLNTAWPLAVNRNTAGGPIRLADNWFDRGIGMHSRSRAMFAVPADVGRWEAWVGLDAVSGVHGNVRVQVEIDGQPALGPVMLAGGEQPRRVVVPVPPGARELALLVDFAAGGDVQDHVNWADARFIRRR